MDKTYTETEIYERIVDKCPAIIGALVGRLQDSDFFDPVDLKISGTIEPDGTVKINDVGAFTEWAVNQMGLVLREFTSSLLVAIFEDDANA